MRQYTLGVVPVGKTFGMWTITGRHSTIRGGKLRTAVDVICQCGTVSSVDMYRLTSSRTSSCRPCSPNYKGAKYSYRLADHAALVNKYMDDYTRNAVRRSLQFTLSKDEFRELILQDCYYDGASPSLELKSSWDKVLVNGIDRMDNSLGYLIGNVVSCCTTCNIMKRTMSTAEYIDHCSKVVIHRNSLV